LTTFICPRSRETPEIGHDCNGTVDHSLF
jgi:hypothetical protein